MCALHLRLHLLCCCLLPFGGVSTVYAATAGAAVVPVAAAPAPSPQDAPFDVLEYEIDGNTVLPPLTLETAVYPHLGPGRGFSAIEAARAALEKAYQEHGYLTVTVIVPQQKVEDGVVRLQVVEGSIERLKVSGNRYHGRSEIRAEAPALAAGEVPHFPTVQQELAALNRAPDRRVTPLLRPGKLPGKLEVELAVEDDLPLHGSIELNNRNSPDTTTQRLEAGLRYDNLFQKHHGIGVNYVVSPQNRDQVEVFSGFYSLPLGEGRSLTLSALRSNSNIGTATDSTVVGKGNTLSLRLALPLRGLANTPAFFHSLAVGFDYKDFKETQNVLGADQKVAPLRYVPITAQYTAGYFGENDDLLGNLTTATGLRGGSQRLIDCQGVQLDQFECRRAGAQANFFYLRGDLSYTRRIQGWELSARGDFQAASQPLVSNEQFLAGGSDSVRGYLEGEAAGDRGWRLRTEVKTPVLLDPEWAVVRGVAFLDGAWLRLQDPLPGQTASFELAGAGVGLRIKSGKRLQFNLDLAQALQAGPRTARGQERAHARLSYQF